MIVLEGSNMYLLFTEVQVKLERMEKGIIQTANGWEFFQNNWKNTKLQMQQAQQMSWTNKKQHILMKFKNTKDKKDIKREADRDHLQKKSN